MKTIRGALLISLLSAIAVAGLVAFIAIYYKALDEANELFDYHLQQLAYALRDQPFERANVLSSGEEPIFDFVIRVWNREGKQLYLSQPHASLPPKPTQSGLQTENTHQGGWRVFSTWIRGRTIQVAQPMHVRNRLAASMAFRLLIPLYVIIPVLGVLVWYIVGHGLHPLDDLARAVTRRTISDLSPLPAVNLPNEVKPLVQALNDLLDHLRLSLDRQRAFIADAAHELRSPLTALQLQTQLAERTKTDSERITAFAKQKQGLKRAVHVVQQLLTLARQEPGAAAPKTSSISLTPLARQVIAEHISLAEEKTIDIGISHIEETVSVIGDGESLHILLGNLVDNAIRYTPSGGHVDIALGRTGERPYLEVSDDGPGIPPEERERVFDRFYRRTGTDVPGSGLGLAIVKSIADHHKATVKLDDRPAGGLIVRVEFPPPADTSTV
jgi:two-component system OmpR family sensor kinase